MCSIMLARKKSLKLDETNDRNVPDENRARKYVGV